MSDFKAGDRVVLLSGGHQMTVDKMSKADNPPGVDAEALCVWHDDVGNPHSHSYALTSLAPFKTPEQVKEEEAAAKAEAKAAK